MTLVPSGISKEVTLSRRFGGGKFSDGGIYTTDAIFTPTTGKAMRLVWFSLLPNTENTLPNVVDIRFDGASKPLYVIYAMAHWELFEGEVDQDLIFNLENSQPVAITVHYEEFVP